MRKTVILSLCHVRCIREKVNIWRKFSQTKQLKCEVLTNVEEYYQNSSVRRYIWFRNYCF